MSPFKIFVTAFYDSELTSGLTFSDVLNIINLWEFVATLCSSVLQLLRGTPSYVPKAYAGLRTEAREFEVVCLTFFTISGPSFQQN